MLRFADVDARVRVLATVAVAASAASVPVHRPEPLAVHALLVAALIAAARPRPRWLAGRLALALVWGAALGATRALSVRSGGSAAALGARVAVALAATIPLAATTSLVALVDALAGLRLPATFVETTAATARGLVILRAEADRLARARLLRAPDAPPSARVRLYGSLAGTLLARGLRRAERSHLAMALRGFDGAAFAGRRRRRLGAPDALCTALVALALAGAHLLP